MILLHRSGSKKSNKKLHRILQSFSNDVRNYSPEKLTECELFVSIGKLPLHSEDDAAMLANFLDRGGSVAVLSAEVEPIVNDFLGLYGMKIEGGAVVRAVYHQPYFHPKHALISNGIVQPFETENKQSQQSDGADAMAFVFPNGTTLNVETPAVPLLTSGSTSFPVDCPLAAAWEATTGNGRLIVVGSSDIFGDEWVEREDNSQLCDIFFKYLLNRVSFDPSLGRFDFEEKECVPDIATLSNLIKPCVQEVAELPQDFRTLLADDQFGLTVEEVIGFSQMEEENFPLPSSQIQMTAHTPRDPEMDEHPTDVHVHLSELLNEQCTDENLSHFVNSAGRIVGVEAVEDDNQDDEGKAKHVLHDVATFLVQSKIGHSESVV